MEVLFIHEIILSTFFNQMQKFYNGDSHVAEVVSIYYQKPTALMSPSLTCFYKDKNKKFFEFYRSLKAYEGSFNTKQDLLVLDQSSDFFDYFKHGLTIKD